jgi:hypothetical protein
MPFRFFDVGGDIQRFDRLLTQGINDYLVQTKKFTVLDREYIKEIAEKFPKVRQELFGQPVDKK